ncbi:MAG: hypothetical protein O7A04_09360 [Acidobacteria bacterium]|nr:hypothetical protein [Acidobacteriota bacterium]
MTCSIADFLNDLEKRTGQKVVRLEISTRTSGGRIMFQGWSVPIEFGLIEQSDRLAETVKRIPEGRR